MNQRPPEINDDYPGLIIPEIMRKTQLEIIEMVENGTFPAAEHKKTETKEDV